MKTIKLLLILVPLLVGAIACTDRDRARLRWLKYKSHTLTTIKESNGYATVKTRYSKGIIFNEAGTAIAKMPPRSYFSYDKDGFLLVIETDEKGKVNYEYYDEDQPMPFDEKGREFLKTAISHIRRLDKNM